MISRAALLLTLAASSFGSVACGGGQRWTTVASSSQGLPRDAVLGLADVRVEGSVSPPSYGRELAARTDALLGATLAEDGDTQWTLATTVVAVKACGANGSAAMRARVAIESKGVPVDVAEIAVQAPCEGDERAVQERLAKSLVRKIADWVGARRG